MVLDLWRLFVTSFIHSLIHSFVYKFVHSFVHIKAGEDEVMLMEDDDIGAVEVIDNCTPDPGILELVNKQVFKVYYKQVMKQ